MPRSDVPLLWPLLRARRWLTLLALPALLVTACSGGDDDSTAAPTTTATSAATATTAPATTPVTTPTTAPSTTTATTAPAGAAFYQPPDPLPEGKPGDLLRSREFAGPAGTRAWTIMYLSRNATDEPIAVTGIVIAPPQVSAPSIVAWAHGTTGLGDQCAPSKAAETGQGAEVLLARAVVDRGQVFVATDYEGLGTPGVHTYVVGQSEGRSVLDSIRAVRQLLELPSDTKAVLWGHSQGGGAALWAAELAPTYAPDANVAGAAAGAPAAELALLGQTLAASSNVGLQLMAVAGFHAAYDLPLELVVTPEGAAVVEAAGDQCTAQTTAAVAGQPASRYFTPEAFGAAPWIEAIAANDPGSTATSVPIFLYHGEDDELIPAAVSAAVAAKYCALDVTVERKVYPGTDHVSVVLAALGDISAYLNARLAGTPAPTTCA